MPLQFNLWELRIKYKTRIEIAECANISCVMKIQRNSLFSSAAAGRFQPVDSPLAKLNIEPLNMALELGCRLAATQINKRGSSDSELLREIADNERTDDPLLLDNLELRIRLTLYPAEEQCR